MRFLAVFGIVTALAACQPTVNEQGEASAALAGMMDPVVASFNGRKGQELSSGISYGQASRDGNTLTGQLVLSPVKSEEFRRYPRGEVQAFLQSRLRQSWCADPSFRVLIDNGGRVRTEMVDNIGRTLVVTTISFC